MNWLYFFKISFLLGTILPFLVGVMVFLRILKNEERDVNFRFAALSFCAAFWSLGFLFLLNAQTYESAYVWRILMDFGSILLPAFWIHFVFVMLSLDKKGSNFLLFAYGFSGVVAAINALDFVFPGIFATELVPKLIFPYYPSAGVGYYLLILFYISCIPYTLIKLYQGIQQNKGIRATQLKFVFYASLLGFAGGSMAFLPTFNVSIIPFGVILFSTYPAIIAYAIFRHHLFDIRVIIAETLTFVLWVLVFFNIFLAENIVSRTFSIILLIVVTIFGFSLIRGVINEIAAREKMQGLIQKIALANKRLVQLEQQKSEFVSIASHQLRTPLTAIKGYASMAIEGSFGKLESVVLEPLNTIFAASQKLVALVEDLLTVSRIEQGRIKYDWAMVDIKGVMEDAIKDNKDDITERRLSVSVRTEKDGMQYLVWADRQRLKQVFNNIIDNAVKFTPKGFVRVLVSKDESRNWVRVAISDTGIGMDKKALEALFVDPQKRAQMADKGDRAAVVGIGIYIAQQIVKTHKGRIWADSDGVNRGSTFFVELPAYEKGKSEAATAQ